MPARNEYGNKTKKKKGRAPAHQNNFAFKHNPCSKKTEKILSLPNIHTCQRCCDKIEWRKQYRKYKLRTQPGTCNGCKKRNVKAAYHTICTTCTTECTKAKEVIKEAQQENPESEVTIRACAVCVKVIALPDPEEEEEDREHIDAMSRLNLRQRKALERKLAKEQADVEVKEEGKDEEDENDNEEDRPQEGLDPLAEEDLLEDNDVFVPDYGDDEEDPFLKAIGGAGKLLTGEAYQRKLLEQKKEKQ